MQPLAGVVDQHVDAAIGRQRRLDQALEVSRGRDVGGDRERTRKFGGQSLEPLGAPRREHHDGTRLSESSGCRGTDSGGGSGDDAHRVREAQRRHTSSLARAGGRTGGQDAADMSDASILGVVSAQWIRTHNAPDAARNRDVHADPATGRRMLGTPAPRERPAPTRWTTGAEGTAT